MDTVNNFDLKIGFFSIGLEAYWPQMPKMREEILKYANNIFNKLSKYGK